MQVPNWVQNIPCRLVPVPLDQIRRTEGTSKKSTRAMRWTFFIHAFVGIVVSYQFTSVDRAAAPKHVEQRKLSTARAPEQQPNGSPPANGERPSAKGSLRTDHCTDEKPCSRHLRIFIISGCCVVGGFFVIYGMFLLYKIRSREEAQDRGTRQCGLT